MNPPNGFGANGMGVSTNGYQHGNLSKVVVLVGKGLKKAAPAVIKAITGK